MAGCHLVPDARVVPGSTHDGVVAHTQGTKGHCSARSGCRHASPSPRPRPGPCTSTAARQPHEARDAGGLSRSGKVLSSSARRTPPRISPSADDPVAAPEVVPGLTAPGGADGPDGPVGAPSRRAPGATTVDRSGATSSLRESMTQGDRSRRCRAASRTSLSTTSTLDTCESAHGGGGGVRG
jgi:hypothetical protein